MIVGGVVMMLIGVGGIFGGVLFIVGVNFLISGYLSEISGDIYLLGWVFGGVGGFIMGLIVGIGGNLFVVVFNVKNLVVFGYLGLGILIFFVGGFVVGGVGLWILNKIENRSFNYEDVIYSGIYLGFLNIIVGFGVGYLFVVFNVGNIIGYRILGIGIFFLVEGIVDLIVYSGDKVVFWIKFNKRKISRIFLIL